MTIIKTLFIANSVPMGYNFNPSLKKRGRGDFMNKFLSKKSPLSPLC